MIRTLFLNRGKTTREEILSDESSQQLTQRCEEAYIQQGQQMAAEGVSPSLIENVAHAAGMATGPLTLANDNPDNHSSNQESADVEIVKQRLMCAQALAAAECWEAGTDPVKADLASTLGWGFPSYTGGVMSYIDTMGLKAFIALCEKLNTQTSAELNPSEWLRRRAQDDDHIYPSTV